MTANQPFLLRTGNPRWLILAITIVILTAIIEVMMGRVIFAETGGIRLWVGDINSNQCSQQITDWYSFSHLLHGFLFYGILYILNRLISKKRWSLMFCLAMAIITESGWEILENSPIIINRYRNATIALGYTGDSVINSVSDVICCTLGFLLAWRLPVRISITLFVITEVALALLIRDNLTLNIIMLIYPIDAIKQWQMG